MSYCSCVISAKPCAAISPRSVSTALPSCNADELYAHIQTLTQTRHDPCVWDTYAAAIHQAKTGEALPWWHFTQIRKQRMALGDWPRSTVSKVQASKHATR